MEQKKKAVRRRDPNTTRTEVRVPKANWERLRNRAKQHHRSTNGEINQAIEQYLAHLDEEEGST